MIGWNDDVVTILAVDPSLRRTGYALLRADYDHDRIDVLHTTSLDNRYYGASHGWLLQNIFDKTVDLAMQADQYVRESAINDITISHPVMHKVHGAMDMALWHAQQRRFIDIPVRKIKRLVCGDELATKAVIMRSLTRYVGPHPYECNDESDAVAVGIAYLRQAGRMDMELVWKNRMPQYMKPKTGGVQLGETDPIAFG